MDGIRWGLVPLGDSDERSNLLFEIEGGKARRQKKSDFLSGVPAVKDTIDAMAAIASPQDGAAVQVTTTGRAGLFRWQSGDLSAEVAADPLHGIYVPADGDDGSGGAWVREYGQSVSHNPQVNVQWFGAVGDGVTDDSGAIQAAVNYSESVFFPLPLVFYRVGVTVILNAQQKLTGATKWADWYLAANQAKSIKGDVGVTVFSTMKPGFSYPSAVPDSQSYVRNIELREMHIQGDGAPAILHHYSSNFLYRDCAIRGRAAPAISMRQSYRGKIDNCFISVGNYAGYALQMYDNCNGIEICGNGYMTGGSIGGVIDVAKSSSVRITGGLYEINGLDCIRFGGLTLAEAEFTEEVGNCNGFEISGCYFERCLEPISVGKNSACLGGVIQNNFVSQYDAGDAYRSCISLGACAGVTIHGNAWRKMTGPHPTLKIFQVAGSPFRYPIKVDWRSNHTQQADLGSGLDFDFDATMPNTLSGYVFGSGHFDFTNSADVGSGGQVDFKVHGDRRTFVTKTITSSDATATFQFDSTDAAGGMIESVEVVGMSGLPDSTLRVGRIGNTGENCIVALSGVSFANGYAKLSLTSQLIRPAADLVVQHVAGASAATFAVRVTYRI